MVAVNRIETVVDYFGGPGRKERRDRLAGEVAFSPGHRVVFSPLAQVHGHGPLPDNIFVQLLCI